MVGMDPNVALSDFASCGTRLSGAKLFRRVHRLCGFLHMLPNANGCLLFQVLLPFSPVSGVLPRIVRKGNLEADGSFARLDLTSLYIERAEALRQFRRFDDAHDALAIAHDSLSPQLTRWQINIMLEEAETYYAQGDHDESATVAIDTLKLVNTLRLNGKKERIRRLYHNLYIWDANYPLVRLLGQELGML